MSGDQPFTLPANPDDYAPKPTGKNLVLIYLRKSYIKGKVDLISIQYQLDVTLPVAWRDQLRFRVYVDAKRSNSARSEQGRADWLRLKAELSHNPDCVGVMMAFQDRASRSTRDTIDLMELCASKGLHFIIPLNGIDTRQTGWTPHIKSMIRSNANIAETESELTSGRMVHRIGQYNAVGVPFGAAHEDVRQRIAECEAWQKTILQQWKRGRIVQADYEREWDDAQDEINRGRAKLNAPSFCGRMNRKIL